MNNTKMKNLHYLNRYINLDSLMKDILGNIEEEKASDGLLKLKEFVKALASELVRYNSLSKEIPLQDFDNILIELHKRKLLTEEQKDLLYSINCYNMFKESKDANRNNLEALRNFSVRIDNELPSIMANLGVGGSTRHKFKEEQNVHIHVSNSPTKKKEHKEEKSAVKTKTNEDNLKNVKVPLSYKLKNIYNSTPGFIIRFIIVGALAGILIYYTFINKLTSDILNDFYSEGIDDANYVWQYIAVTVPEAFFGLLGRFFNGIASILNFLRFE